MFGNRGQAYTLQGIIGAILVATSVIFGLQAVDIAPWTDNSGEAVDSLRTQVQDALAVMAENGTLRRTVTCLNNTTPSAPSGNWQIPSSVGNRTSEGSATQFGPTLNHTLHQRGYRYNVYFQFYRDRTTIKTLHVYPRNELVPDSDAVSVSRRVVLFNSTAMTKITEGCTGDWRTLESLHADSDENVYLGHVSDSTVYNVVEVRIVAW